MSEPALKYENMLFLIKTKPTLKLFIAFKMAYSCSFCFRGNLDFPYFLQKSFITSTAGTKAQSGIKFHDVSGSRTSDVDRKIWQLERQLVQPDHDV